MFQISPELTEALVIGVANLISGVVGVFLGIKQSSSGHSSQLHLDQLHKLYEPIMSKFLKYGDALPSDAMDEVTTLLLDHNSYAAPKLLEEWNNIRNSESPDFSKFRKILTSNYEWVRKQLGYPCNPENIVMSHIPNRGKHRSIYAICLVLSIVAGLFTLILLQRSDVFLIKFEFFCIMLLCYLFAHYCVICLFSELRKI